MSVEPEGAARATRAMGLVSEASTRNAPLDARLAIGHTRYSTAGSSTIENAQPVLARSRDGHIALAHNGNLINAAELRRELEDAGSIFASTIDSEVIVHASRKSTASAPEIRLADALAASKARTASSSRSATRCSPRATRAAGARSSWAQLDGAIVFASETCALDIVGATDDARRRAGRDHCCRCRRRCARSFPLRAQELNALRVRVRLLRAARQPRLRRLGRPRAPRARAAARARDAGARR